MEAWHWNPEGTWSDPAGKGYFTGSANPGSRTHSSFLRLSLASSRSDARRRHGYGGLFATHRWRCEFVLEKQSVFVRHFHRGNDTLHPQWVIIDLANRHEVNAIRIEWAEPYATRYVVQYFTGNDPIKKPTEGVWQTFSGGMVTGGKGGAAVLHLASAPILVQHMRILMTQSSNTCDTHGSDDKRNCLGYAIRELYIGTTTARRQISRSGSPHT